MRRAEPALQRELGGRLANYLRASNEEPKHFARLTGNDDVHALCIRDLCTLNSEFSPQHTDIERV